MTSGALVAAALVLAVPSVARSSEPEGPRTHLRVRADVGPLYSQITASHSRNFSRSHQLRDSPAVGAGLVLGFL